MAYTRTKQPVIGGYSDAMDYNKETNTLEVGTNLEVDGGLFSNSLAVFDNYVNFYGTVQLGETGDGIYRRYHNNEDKVYYFEGYPKTVITTAYFKYDDDFVIQSEGSQTKIVYRVKSFSINDHEAITGAEAVINDGRPQLNLKQGNNIVEACDLSPVFSKIPVDILGGLGVSNITYDGTNYYGDVSATLEEIRAFVLKHDRFVPQTGSQKAIYTLCNLAPYDMQSYPTDYFSFFTVVPDTKSISVMTIYSEYVDETEEELKLKIKY